MMSESGPINETEQATLNDSASHAAADPATAFSKIVQLASQSPTRRRFYCDCLNCIGSALNSPFATLDADLSSEVIKETYHHGPTDPQFWRQTVDQLLNTTVSDYEDQLKLYGAKNSDSDSPASQVAIMTALLKSSSGGSFGVVGVVVECRSANEAAAIHAVMKSLVALVGDCSSLLENYSGSDSSSSESAANDAGVINKAAAYGSIDEMAIAITNNLQNRTGCEQVALGYVKGHGIKLLSISGFDEVKSRTPGAEVVISAMTECLDAGHAVAWPSKDGEDGDGSFLLHKRWSGSVQGAAVASVPLLVNGKISAILAFRRNSEEPFSTTKLAELAANMAPYATAMTLVKKATESAVGHVKRSAGEAIAHALAPGHIVRKCLLAAVVLTASWVAFGSLEYKVTAPATVKPAEFRNFSVPFDAELVAAPLATGDTVQAGMMICEFDTSRWQQQKRQLQAQLEMAQIEANKARNQQNPSESAIAEAEAKRLLALIAEADAMIDRAAVTAPFDGTVISGDLRRRVGQMLPRGETLYSIASDQGWRLSVDIPQMYAAELRKNLKGKFVANARPGAVLNLNVLRVNPASQALNGTNSFSCEASLDADQQWIRSGMEGVARVELGRRPVWWILSHRIVNFVRMKLWI